MKKMMVVAMLAFGACTASKQTTQTNFGNQPLSSKNGLLDSVLNNPIFAPAHVGIAVFEPATNQYLYNYQGSKYFVPASNTKIFTCYAAMQHLADSLIGLKYITEDQVNYTVQFAADPTLLSPAFKTHPVAHFFAQHKNVQVVKAKFTADRWGNGWAWNDYADDYMSENSAAPIYGNLMNISKKVNSLQVTPKLFKDSVTILANLQKGLVHIDRDFSSNNFLIKEGNNRLGSISVPFVTSENLTVTLLEDTLHNTIYFNDAEVKDAKWMPIYSQATDSMLSIMMHVSDNFFAEQTLLMVSNQMLDEMNDEKVIDSLLKTDFAGLPQKPKWVDGSGLSRYNLITPQDFVWVLTQMKQKFSWERIRSIFPTGNKGTLSGYYKNYAGKIYAKTGTLSNHVALSGFLITNSGRQLVFSFLVNAHQSSASEVRRTIEQFLTAIIERN